MRWSTSSTAIPDGNAGTRVSLARMSQLATQGRADPLVIQSAHSVVRNVPERDDRATMAALLTDVRLRLRYTHDPIDVELVKSPRAALEECRAHGGKFVGDCDDACVLLAAMLGAVGLHSRFVVVPTDRGRPGEWSHVYVSARTRDGAWVALDPIVRSFGLGDEVPSSDLSGPRRYFPAASGGTSMPRLAGLGITPAAFTAARAASAKPATSSESSWWEQLLGVTGDVAKTYIEGRYRPQQPIVLTAAGTTGPTTQPPSQGFFTNPDGSTNWTKVAVVGAVGVGVAVAVAAVVRGRRRR